MYANSRKVIELFEAETGEPFCVATVNIPDAFLLKQEVVIKDYSENEGILSPISPLKALTFLSFALFPQQFGPDGSIAVPE